MWEIQKCPDNVMTLVIYPRSHTHAQICIGGSESMSLAMASSLINPKSKLFFADNVVRPMLGASTHIDGSYSVTGSLVFCFYFYEARGQ
jgi:hypothetical protein